MAQRFIATLGLAPPSDPTDVKDRIVSWSYEGGERKERRFPATALSPSVKFPIEAAGQLATVSVLNVDIGGATGIPATVEFAIVDGVLPEAMGEFAVSVNMKDEADDADPNFSEGA